MKRVEYRNNYFYILLSFLGVVWGIFYCKFADSFDILFHTTAAKYILGNELGMPNSIPHVLAYPLYHVAVKMFVFILRIPYEGAAALVICISNIVSILLYRKLLMLVLKECESNYFLDFISIGAVIFMPAKSWLTNYTIYAIHTGANPLHNPTVLFARPFGLVCIIYFINLLENYQNKRIDLKYLIGFSVTALLGVFAKPSFAMVFFPAMGIVCLYIMIKRRDVIWGIYMLLGIIPSIIALLWQMNYMKGTGVAIKYIWRGYTVEFGYNSFDIIKVTLGVVPAAFILINKTRNRSYIFAWISFVIGWLQMFTLSNGGTGDFAWGFMLAMQFLMVVSLAISVCDKTEKVGNWRSIAGVGVFIYQFYIGIQYFRHVFTYGDYWV